MSGRRRRGAEGRLAAFLALVAAARLATGCGDFATVGILPLGDAGGGPSASAPGEDAAPSVLAINDCEAKNAAGFDPQAASAVSPGPDGGAMRWLYPYDGTVFPGGLGAPLLMWDGPAGDGVYVRLRSESFDYQGCFKPSSPGQLQFPQYAWDAAQSPAGIGSGHFELTLATVSQGRLQASVVSRVTLSNEKLPAALYYMSIGSTLAVAADGVTNVGQSTVLRLQPGHPAEPVFASTFCTGCHSVAANGKRLVASTSGSGTAYGIAPNGVAPATLASALPGGEYPALSPDGALYVAEAHPGGGVGPRSYGASAQTASGLFETSTGNPIDGSGVPPQALTPAFAPDGKWLAFNDFAQGAGHALSLMAFSTSARRASGYRSFFSDSQNYPAWPTFLPGDQAVVFQLGAGSDFSGGASGVLGVITPGPRTDLYLASVAGGRGVLLAQAMGFRNPEDASTETTYLPFGATDLHQSYYPTILPEASGGYYWVFFDSRRNYGNLGNPRQIWGAAVDIAPDGSYQADPSHPAFYVPGQELGAGNFRAVAVMNL